LMWAGTLPFGWLIETPEYIFKSFAKSQSKFNKLI